MALPLAYDLPLRPRLLTWGATNEEVAGTYPGDEFITDPNGGATMATTLPAPPAAVWLWLVQMGGGRDGWYSWTTSTTRVNLAPTGSSPPGNTCDSGSN